MPDRECRAYQLVVELPEGWNGRDGEMFLTGALRGSKLNLVDIKQQEELCQ